MAKLFDTSITGSLIISNYIKLEANDNPTLKPGAIYFDSSAQKIKFTTNNTLGWSSITAVPGFGRTYAGGIGCSNAAIIVGGGIVNSPTVCFNADSWNGASWSSAGSLTTGRCQAATSGTQNTAFVSAGYFTVALNDTEVYNGASWSAGPNMSTARFGLSGVGTSISGVAFGGTPSCTATEEYDGLAWSGGGSMSTGRGRFGGAGSVTAAIAAGGFASPAYSITEQYDGGTWSSGGSINTARYGAGGSGGSALCAMIFGGNFGDFSFASEVYNGLTWSVTCNTTTPAREGTAGGSCHPTIAVGGQSPTRVTCASVFSFGPEIKTWNFE